MSPAQGNVRVVIATTTGLVSVQRITEEDPDVSSVVCLAGKAVALPISGAYEAFVRDPTGVIQRHFGHPAYRVDVSATIDEGYSWQLGLFAAHALMKAGRLAARDETAASTLIATGEVDRDLNVLAVDHIQEKFGDFTDKLGDVNSAAERTFLAVPSANAQAVARALHEVKAVSRILNVETAHDLLGHLGLKTSEAAPASPRAVDAVPPPKRRTGRALLLALLFGLFAAGAGAVGVNYSPELREMAGRWMPALATPIAEPAPVPTAPTTASNPSSAAEPVTEPPLASVPAPAPEPADPNPPQPAPDPVPVAKVEPAPPPEPLKVEPLPVEKAETRPSAPTPPPLKETLEPVKTAATKDVLETAHLREAPVNAVELMITELRAPPGYSCRDVREDRARPIETQAEQRGPFAFSPAVMENLCTVEIEAVAEDDDIYVFGRYQRWTKTRPNKGPADKVIDLGPRRGSVHWSVDIPERLGRGAVFQVVVLSSYDNFTVPTRPLERIAKNPRNPNLRKLVNRLKKRGIAMTATRFRVVPERRLNRRPPPRRVPPPPNG